MCNAPGAWIVARRQRAPLCRLRRPRPKAHCAACLGVQQLAQLSGQGEHVPLGSGMAAAWLSLLLS